MRDIFIAVIGLGTVGRSVVEILQQNKDLLASRAGVNLVPKIGIANNIENKKDLNIKLSTDINDALDDESIDIIVELIGGIDIAYNIALKSLKNKKAFVTANKAMLAYHRYELEKLSMSANIPIGFEASVCGGIPIIKALRDGLCANHIISIKGIMNGTSNFILTKMTNENMDFESALKIAQDLGYAELNPLLDINGIDCAHKLLILCSLAYNINASLDDIIVEGMQGLSIDDILFAREFNYEIKLLGIAKKIDNVLEMRVHLCLIDKHCMIAKVEGAMNAVSVLGDNVGELFYYGAGAGGKQTASSVVSDIVEIARGKSLPMLGYKMESQGQIELKHASDIQTRYYLRLIVQDKLGVLGLIANILNKNHISVKSLMQKDASGAYSNLSSNNDIVLLLLSTHTCKEIDFQHALEELKNLKEVVGAPFMIRIED